jgi:hypothetical protein
MTKPSKNYGFIHCDSEFDAIEQDLDMSTMGIVKGIPMYQMPDISRELMLLEEQLKFSAKGKEDKHMLAIGTKVIVRTCDDYNGRHCGRVGTVCRHFAKDKKVGVMFEGIKNTASKDGVFWFQDANLTPYKEPSTALTSNDVKNVIFSGGKTIVLWADGTKTIVTCGEGDVFDPYAGFCAAVTKRMFGTTRNAMRALEKTSKTATPKKKEALPTTEG